MTSSSALQNLRPALQQLDRLLAHAVAAIQGRGVPNADPFRGLHIGPDDVARWLAYEPGSPFFETAADDMATPLDNDFSGLVNESPRFAWLAENFGLSGFDLGLVIIALAPQVDLRYEGLYAYLQDDVTRRQPSVDLALNLLCTSKNDKFGRRAHLSPESQLVRNRILRLTTTRPDAPLLAHTMHLDPQISDALLSQSGLDRRLASFCKVEWPEPTAGSAALVRAIQPRVAALFREAVVSGKPIRFYFHGPDGIGKHQTAEVLTADAGMCLLHANLRRAKLAEIGFEEAIPLAFREAWLQGAVLYLDEVDSLRTPELSAHFQLVIQHLADHSGIVILAGVEAWIPSKRIPAGVLEVQFRFPNVAERKASWQWVLEQHGVAVDGADLEALAARFRLSRGQIANAVSVAVSHAIAGSGEDERRVIVMDDLKAAARAQSGHELATLARKIEPVYTWNDIVLPPDATAQLHELCSRVVHGSRVLGEWGFGQKLSQGKGANALFAGPSGTGKTMATEIIANELSLDLYKIDLSGVVSKYIGETEKNLDRIFTAAEDSNAILLFDEADALFGKRSEVRDSHDRYANIEISYLLQKMEQYEGVSILATNLRQNLDDAFVRRLAFTVHFPSPGEADRRRIWSRIWPEATPLGSDVDFDFLARQFRLPGGNIKNIALAAAFFAANNGGVVTMSYLLHATQREFQKMGKTLSQTELNGHGLMTYEGEPA